MRKRWSNAPFGDALEKLMEDQHVTFRRLAEEVGLSAGYLCHIVHGSRPVPENEIVERIAGVFGQDAEHFREMRVRAIAAALLAGPTADLDRAYRRLFA